ncbi:hypothetical protein DZB84_14305 [Bacillus sp. HNG]|uniref:hypothetical protein n=1 Tax=Bacillus sp. HNG TaxID=2293325 RepID=UPI000E2E7163|nr:hypothetical protein [Bacillus sp. HNG]RFB15075.1 hypothetical protein DZB84_14305 [Bacillus sp. HNG]
MSDGKKGRGRPSTKFEEEELYAIISHYRENVKSQGDIKYLQLYKYHLELHNERPDICSRTYSEDFWRKKDQPGRKAIDTANEIRTVTLVDGNENKKDIPNVVDVAYKYANNPERLIKHLLPLENEVRRSIQKERELMQKNESLKQQIKQEKEGNSELRKRVKHLKECVFKLFHYSDKDGTPLKNLLDMNNANKRINRALEEAFRNPQDFYTELEVFRQQSTNEVTKKENVVSLTDGRNKQKKTLADDFKGRF